VPFPFSDLSRAKRRPALVVSSDAYNEASNDILIAQITSRLDGPPLPGDHAVAGWKEAGLLAPSLVRPRLTTLHAALPLRALGHMPSNDMKAVDRGLALALGL
jgi:mRNA interferase MazF